MGTDEEEEDCCQKSSNTNNVKLCKLILITFQLFLHHHRHYSGFTGRTDGCTQMMPLNIPNLLPLRLSKEKECIFSSSIFAFDLATPPLYYRAHTVSASDITWQGEARLWHLICCSSLLSLCNDQEINFIGIAFYTRWQIFILLLLLLFIDAIEMLFPESKGPMVWYLLIHLWNILA